MKSFYPICKLFLAIFSILLYNPCFSQTVRDACVDVQCDVDPSSSEIRLSWSRSDVATRYQVFRKVKGTATWGTAVGTLTGDATSFVDTDYTLGNNFEYRIIKTSPGVTGYGYINAGLYIEPVEYRGKLILVVDNSVKDSLAIEVQRLKSDLVGDGWSVETIIVGRQDDVVDVKKSIVAIYNKDKSGTKALFLLGHVPVPYSGNLAPDGHPDHVGAWPADGYYADMNGVWTDTQVNTETASAERNRNVPGDGKFDQSTFPSAIELQVGRVDMSGLPAFGVSEITLLRRYLNKDHNYRHGIIKSEKRAIVDDNFGYFSGEAFSSSARRSLGGLVGNANIADGDYIESMKTGSYQWSYGCGGGSYQSAGGIGNTSQIAQTNLQGVFSMLFGSYFGDWDSENNFLRAPLASGTVLTNVWAGRPEWYFHHMGLGENIGYSVRLNMNLDNTQYASHYGTKFVHIALMGDPTLRNDIIDPVQQVSATSQGANINVSWTDASSRPLTLVNGYAIYIKSPKDSIFSWLRDIDIDTRQTNIPCQTDPGRYIFMVKAIESTKNYSGIYTNFSQGIFDTIDHINIPTGPIAAATFSISQNLLNVTNLSTSATEYLWDFGDGKMSNEKNPMHIFDSIGTYIVTLVATDGCRSDTIAYTIGVLSGINEEKGIESTIYPNPTQGIIHLTLGKLDRIEITNSLGQIIKVFFHVNDQIDVSDLSAGPYWINAFKGEMKVVAKKVILIK